MTFTPVPKPEPRSESDRLTARIASARKLNANRKPIPRSSSPSRTAPPKRENKERKAKRQARFKARLSRADWKKLRMEVFDRDGFRCTATAWSEMLGSPRYESRCPNADESRTGRGLVADHLTYARFGHELLEDLRTLCRSCNARETKAKRANHAQGFRFGGREGR